MKGKQPVLCAALLAALLAAGCGVQKDTTPPQAEEAPEPVQIVFMNPLVPPEDGVRSTEIPNLLPKIREMDALNSDTVGWLQVADTTIDDVVVQHPGDTGNLDAFYLRRDFMGNYLFDGTYFVDYRANMDGTVSGLSPNTVIYGHSYTDNPAGRLMDQLKRYREEEEYARQNPYVFFSIEEKELLWEVFAVFDAKTDFNYNLPEPPTEEQYRALIADARSRSYYNYDTEVTTKDRILTLSTCTYNYTTVYPNDYRYVVMARLVQPGEKLKKKAALQINDSRKLP